MQLVTYTATPISGYWDGGAQNRFTWTLGRVQKDKRGEYVRIHGWEANHWFHVAKGKTEKQTLSYALRRLRKYLEKNGTPISYYEYIQSE